jgi:hypothetical protein
MLSFIEKYSVLKETMARYLGSMFDAVSVGGRCN